MKQEESRARGLWVRRLTAGIAAGALVAAMAAPMAYADSNPEIGDGQRGTGETDLIVKIDQREYGGTDATGEWANPDSDSDGLGDNLAFTVPTVLDFTAKADGSMTMAQSYIENFSVYKVHVSSLDVDAESGWAIESDATTSTTANVVDFKIGPTNTVQLDAASYLTKAAVTTPSAWNMAAHESGTNDQLTIMSTSGHINNVSNDIADSGAKFGTIKWYLTAGQAQAS